MVSWDKVYDNDKSIISVLFFFCKSRPLQNCTEYRGCLTSVLSPFFYLKWNDAQSSCAVREKKKDTWNGEYNLAYSILISDWSASNHEIPLSHEHWKEKSDVRQQKFTAQPTRLEAEL